MSETISFYSFKGGTGRSLVLAHVAYYLRSFGKNVFAIDLDLEAPGLQYKLGLGRSSAISIQRGMVDLLQTANSHQAPSHLDLNDYVVDVAPAEDEAGWLKLLGAGDIHVESYWSRLASINWHTLFYNDRGSQQGGAIPPGIPFFLDLHSRIVDEFAPDYILIDSRTGVTDISAIATTLLADKVVALLVNNLESIEGTKQVLERIIAAPRLPTQLPVSVFAVLARVPQEVDADSELRLTELVREALNIRRSDGSVLVSDVYVFHSEWTLQLSERLLSGGTAREEPPLLRDYLHLFAALIDRSVVEPRIQQLVDAAYYKALDDPDSAQADLEALAAIYPVTESYRALLKFYRLRRAAPDDLLRISARLWATSVKDPRDPLLCSVVSDNFSTTLTTPARRREIIPFVEAAWAAGSLREPRIGLELAKYYLVGRTRQRAKKAAAVLSQVIGLTETLDSILIEAIRLAASEMSPDEFIAILPDLRVKFVSDEQFQVTLADVVTETENKGLATRLIEEGVLPLWHLKETNPNAFVGLSLLSGEPRGAREEVVEGVLDRAGYRVSEDVESLARVYYRLDASAEFTSIARSLMEDNDVEELTQKLLRSVPRRMPRAAKLAATVTER